MRRIDPYSLWIGSAGDVRDLGRLRRLGVMALVDLALAEEPLRVGREVVYGRFPLHDGPGNARGVLHAAIHAVASLVRSNTPVLVFCGAGMSRSPSIVAAALSVVTGRRPEACLTEIVKHGAVDINPSLWASVLGAITDPLTKVREGFEASE